MNRNRYSYGTPRHAPINPPDDEAPPSYPPPASPPPPSDSQPSTSRPLHPPDTPAPPEWEASVGDARVAQLFPYGVYHDAGQNNYERGVRFIQMHPNINPPQYISWETLNLIRTHGQGAWTVLPPSQFDGRVSRNRSGTSEVKSNFSSTEDKTLVSSLPVLWGNYGAKDGSKGVYYEVSIDKLGRDAVVAVGFGCLPYPTDFRLPGWHRHSAAVHSDDGFKFFENPDGGVPFTNPIKKKGDIPQSSRP